jgi:hypothetical protein
LIPASLLGRELPAQNRSAHITAAADPTAFALAQRRLVANSLLAAATLLLAMLRVAPPGRFSLYPACPIHRLFGVDCPGCGATRALAALLHGQLREALHFNALFVLLLPIALAGAISSYRRAIRTGEFRFPHPPTAAIYATLAAAAVFTIERNVIR